MAKSPSRRSFLLRSLTAAAAAVLAGCDRISRSSWAPGLLRTGERVNGGVQKALTPKNALAQEFSESDLSPEFRSNGTASPDDPEYQRHAAADFAHWTLRVDG